MSKVSVELLRGPAEEDEGTKIYGVTTGTVGPMPDPFMQGRVQVIMHFLDCEDFSAFARVATPFAGMLSGSYFVPMPGDEVLVAFERGDINNPFVIGALWNLKALPPVPSQLTTIKTIRNQTGSQIVFADTPPSLTLQSSAPAAVPAAPTAPSNIVLSPGLVQIVVGTTSINITPAGIVMQSGSNTVSLTSAGIVVQSASAVVVKGSVISLN
jgi:hypothetical protein